MLLWCNTYSNAIFKAEYPIPLWEKCVIRVKLLSSLFRVRVRDPLNIRSGVPSNRRTVTRVRQKHLNNWWWCFMVQWRIELSLLWIQVEKRICTLVKNSHAYRVKTARGQTMSHVKAHLAIHLLLDAELQSVLNARPRPSVGSVRATHILLKTSVQSQQ